MYSIRFWFGNGETEHHVYFFQYYTAAVHLRVQFDVHEFGTICI